MKNSTLEQYTLPTKFVDSNQAEVVAYANRQTYGISNPVEQIVELFYAVRDGFRYDIREMSIDVEDLRASALLDRDYGSCLEKANLLAASYRALGIPSRLGFLNVRSQFTSQTLRKVLNSDVIVFQGYAEVWLEDHWVCVNPAFDPKTAQKLGIKALDFGLSGKEHIDIIKDFGTFADLPYDLYLQELQTHYPHLFLLPDSSPDEFLDYLDSLV